MLTRMAPLLTRMARMLTRMTRWLAGSHIIHTLPQASFPRGKPVVASQNVLGCILKLCQS